MVELKVLEIKDEGKTVMEARLVRTPEFDNTKVNPLVAAARAMIAMAFWFGGALVILWFLGMFE